MDVAIIGQDAGKSGNIAPTRDAFKPGQLPEQISARYITMDSEASGSQFLAQIDQETAQGNPKIGADKPAGDFPVCRDGPARCRDHEVNIRRRGLFRGRQDSILLVEERLRKNA